MSKFSINLDGVKSTFLKGILSSAFSGHKKMSSEIMDIADNMDCLGEMGDSIRSSLIMLADRTQKDSTSLQSLQQAMKSTIEQYESSEQNIIGDMINLPGWITNKKGSGKSDFGASAALGVGLAASSYDSKWRQQEKEVKERINAYMSVAVNATNKWVNTANNSVPPGTTIAKRTTPPDHNSEFYSTEKNGYMGYSMPNCTAYAYGRVYEMTGEKPNVSMGNGNSFFEYNRNNHVYNYSQDANEPHVGAIVCYGGEFGHVQVVEEVGQDEQGKYIIVSESNYSGRQSGREWKAFNVLKIHVNDLGTTRGQYLEDGDNYSEPDNYVESGGYFQGYIYAVE